MMSAEERFEIYKRAQVIFDEIFDRIEVEGLCEKTLDYAMEYYDANREYIFGCKEDEHFWLDDQCGKPEHRYCGTCNIRYDAWEKTQDA